MNHPLYHLTAARLREFYREPGVLFWVFGFPILLALVLGLAFQSGVRPKVPVAVTEGPQGDARAAVLAREPGLFVKRVSDDEARRLMRAGKAFLIVHGDAEPAYEYDPTRPESEGLRRQVDDALQAAAGRRDVVRARDVPVKQQGSRYIDFLIPGLLGMNIMGSSMWGIGWAIVQMRTRKLLKRLVATPMRRRDFLLSQVLSRMLFLLLEVGLVLGFAYGVFHIRVLGSGTGLVALSFAGALAFAGIGLLVASRAQTSEVVSGLMNAVMFPMWLLSGVFFSADNFPGWLQPLIRFLPLTVLNDGLRAAMNEGAGLAAMLVPVAVLSAWAAVTFAVALRIFRWN
jgi:ABC-type multidrug transport system permease subunit